MAKEKQWPLIPGLTARYESDSVFLHFDSVAVMAEYANRPIHNSENETFRQIVMGPRKDKGKEWYGVPTSAEALAILSAGVWPAGADRLIAELGDISGKFAPPQSIRRRLVRADQGDALDIHAANRGDIGRAWSVAKRKSIISAQTVIIDVHTSMTWSVPADQLFWRGATALILADQLCDAGYSVEINAHFCSQNSDSSDRLLYISVCAKESHEPMDLARLAASVCLASTFRILKLASCCQSPYTVAPNFGQSIPLPPLNSQTGARHIRIDKDVVISAATARKFLETANWIEGEI
jgi:hypothetical protein